MSSLYTLWHNPRCSKSRETLQILLDHNITPHIREYLTDAPNAEEIRTVLTLLGKNTDNAKEVLEIVRTKEKLWKEENITLSSLSAPEIIHALAQFPKGIERPICIKNNEIAVLGRPPENILPLLK